MNIRRPARPPAPGARVRALLAGLLTLVGVLGFTATTASAAGLPAAQTRVGAFTSTAGVLVGPSAVVSPGQGRVQPVPQPGFVVATGVAANPGIISSEQSVEQNAASVLAQPEGYGFSGVHDPASGAIHARLSSGPEALVDRFGGHGTINEQVFGDSSNTVGFVAVVRANGLDVRWNSASVNFRNFGDRAAPEEFRSGILAALRNATGLEASG